MLLLTPFEDSAEAYARKYSLRSKFQWKEEEEFLWNMWKEDKFWDSIWKHTVVKNQTIATNGTTSLEAGDLRIHLRNVVENKQIIATSVTMLVHNMAILESIWNTQRRKVKQMQPVWFCIYSGRQFENAFESSQWREAKQMQPMWLCILRHWRCESTFAIHSREKPPLLGDLGVKLLKHHYLNHHRHLHEHLLYHGNLLYHNHHF